MKKLLFLMIFIFGASRLDARICEQNESDPCSTPTCPCCYTCDNCTDGCCMRANSSSYDYETCNKATCLGHIFCKSIDKMTWWDTFAWCENQGRHLAKFEELCPNIEPAENPLHGACPNLTSVTGSMAANYTWASYPYGSHSALLVSLTSGGISEYHGYRTSGNHYYAFCY